MVRVSVNVSDRVSAIVRFMVRVMVIFRVSANVILIVNDICMFT